ncbi:MAG: adenylyl-sulfate kinase [Candidatus Jordarchaeales archaeon]|nr:adenylyl-sulfate kinase [Candidatus Jordarchaeia archaeon]
MAWTVWLFGLPGSGKSTIARELQGLLAERDIKSQILSTDLLRKVVTPNPTYSEEEREIVYGVLVFIARLLNDNGINVIIDATANRKAYREKGRKEIENILFVYVKCPLEVCMRREATRKETYGAPRKIYEKGLSGESRTVPGLGVPFEEPENPDVIVESDKLSPKECALKIFNNIMNRFYGKVNYL